MVGAGSALFSLGLAPVFTLTTDLVVSSAPPEHAGAAAALSEAGAELGGALGIAGFGSLGVAVYRHAIMGALPANLPEAARQAASATLGGASAVAAQLPHAAGIALLAAAREAFIDSVRACATLSVVGALGLALFTALALRKLVKS